MGGSEVGNKWLLIALLAVSAPATAQTAEPAGSRVVIVGTGTLKLPPDFGVVQFKLRGEGRTADAAAQTLATARQTLERSLQAVPGAKVEVRTNSLSFNVVRKSGCGNAMGDVQQQLSEGDCAITGHIAELDYYVRVSPAPLAGTVLAQAARRGVQSGAIGGFFLLNAGDAEQNATALALVDARRQADAIAAAERSRIGRLIRVQNQMAYGSGDDESAELMVAGIPAGAPPSADPPIRMDLAPLPVETTARLIVTYELLPASPR